MTTTLPYSWTLWQHNRHRPPIDPEDFRNANSLMYLETTVPLTFPAFGADSTTQQVDSVEQMWQSLCLLKSPQVAHAGTEFLVFKTGVQPMWEDPVNAKGGRWVFRLPRRQQGSTSPSLVRYRTALMWERLVLRTLGGTLVPGVHGDEVMRDVCGLVLSVRKDEDLISVWHANLVVRGNDVVEYETEVDDDKKRLTHMGVRRILCDAVWRVVREADAIASGTSPVGFTDDGPRERVLGVSCDYRMHQQQQEVPHRPSTRNYGDAPARGGRRYKQRPTSANTVEAIVGGSAEEFGALGRVSRTESDEPTGLMSFLRRRREQQQRGE